MKKLTELKKSKLLARRSKIKSVSPMKKIEIFSKRGKFDDLSPFGSKYPKRNSPKKKTLSKRISNAQRMFKFPCPRRKKYSIVNDAERTKASLHRTNVVSQAREDTSMLKSKRFVSNFFSFDTFGDLGLPKKKISRR